MSTKQNLIDELIAEVHKTGSLDLVSRPAFEADGFKVYNLTYYDDLISPSASGGVLNVRNADMIVEGDETPGEEAWWLNGTPVTITAFVPYMAALMSDYRRPDKFDTSSLKYVTLSGAKTPVHVYKKLTKTYPHIKFINTYGMSEAGSRIAIAAPKPNDFSKW